MSMPSSVYRTEDPLYTKEIEKLKSDKKISHWFTHKSGNANFVTKIRAPKLKSKLDELYKKYRKEAKEEYEKGKSIKKSSSNILYVDIAQKYEEVKKGQMSFVDIPNILRDKNKFNDYEIREYMKKYNNYVRNYKLMHPNESEPDE